MFLCGIVSCMASPTARNKRLQTVTAAAYTGKSAQFGTFLYSIQYTVYTVKFNFLNVYCTLDKGQNVPNSPKQLEQVGLFAFDPKNLVFVKCVLSLEP